MKKQIIDTIEKYDKIIILRHVRPDPDAYGSQMGLKEIILKNYPQKKVYAAGDHDDALTYLAVPEDISLEMYKDALIIVTDTGNTERIDGEYYTEGALLMKIDHHPDADPYGDVKWVDTSASSTSEMIIDLFEYGKAHYDWHMPDAAARLLFAGIVGDTGRFMYPSTTVKTFQRASELLKYNFDRTKLFTSMYEVNRNVLNLQGYLYQNFNMDEYGAAYIKIDREILKQFDVSPSEASQLVSSLGEVKGICAWVILIEEEDLIRVRLRSKETVINELAAEYGGGGHPLAAGASVYSWEEADELISKLQQLCR
ncbi:DHH family phosphoesterase [Sporosarcina ureilytica]|uniref:DHH family phosphoesterase n=1 Tax=Sporosarcina ureilytica TaxID=298596 RepID=A0A1D8JEX0_9BACL|nr:bifunctional oligoribonuclease/PAP phosphatase NrnA [Sporosarcina ureilytica]AOV07228.1 DHH family phosphoesterase [Sporosarcina ureilytica]